MQVPLVDVREGRQPVLQLQRPFERDALLRFHQAQLSVSDIARDLRVPMGTGKPRIASRRVPSLAR
jgi:hypothetical protein